MVCFSFFFFNDTATTEIYTLSLPDALPISAFAAPGRTVATIGRLDAMSTSAWTFSFRRRRVATMRPPRSEEHTSELQSQSNLVCRLLLEKKYHHSQRTGQKYRVSVFTS